MVIHVFYFNANGRELNVNYHKNKMVVIVCVIKKNEK
jgi:hypothetical protein